jgi:hypothetical protein
LIPKSLIRADRLYFPDPDDHRQTLSAATALLHGLAAVTPDPADLAPNGAKIIKCLFLSPEPSEDVLVVVFRQTEDLPLGSAQEPRPWAPRGLGTGTNSFA